MEQQEESACQYRRCKRRGFDAWVGNITWSRKWQPTPVFLPGKSMEREVWWATVHGVPKRWPRLSMDTGWGGAAYVPYIYVGFPGHKILGLHLIFLNVLNILPFFFCHEVSKSDHKLNFFSF